MQWAAESKKDSKMSVDDIYRDELLDIYKNPVHKGKIEDPSVEVFEQNPLCGDQIHLQLKVEDGVIIEAKFYGSACVVSVVSSEMLADFIIGKSVEEAGKITKEDLLDLINLNLSTSRVKCATLVLTALREALKKYER